MPITAEDFVQVSSRNPLDFAAMDAAIAYISKSPTGWAVISEMAERGIRVSINHNGDDSFSGSTGVLNWDPDSGLQILDGEGIRSKFGTCRESQKVTQNQVIRKAAFTFYMYLTPAASRVNFKSIQRFCEPRREGGHWRVACNTRSTRTMSPAVS